MDQEKKIDNDEKIESISEKNIYSIKDLLKIKNELYENENKVLICFFEKNTPK